MKRDPLAYRYANALFDLAKERDQLELIGEELQAVKDVFEETNLLDEVFRHPSITNEEKKSLLKTHFGTQVSGAVMNLLFLLVDRKRISIILAVADEYKRLSYASRGVAEATVYTAKPLSEEERQAVKDTFAKKTNTGELLLDEVNDPDVLGGFKIRIGDRVFDASVASQLERIHKRMIYGNASR
ncbi:F0F1 ATP synthase subunit delta [Alteribacter keqinensis]|uniref:ATP synthase subunit delta n=1 Tax=Alteribacter keqinensis TaxID=2483800 RepID=A0A3M7TQ94_9BACI|nr:F0F1 ATP synthase subunit delta [Alteribacter keqinensis]RNA67816.1 F0F1 ATP synthase subunit delta [Alteribacter keqinensis]